MGDESTVPQYEKQEGVRPPDDPRYPPHSVLRPEVRRSAWFSSVGLLIVLAVAIGVGMLYWVFREKGRVDPSTPQAVGTVGTAPGGLGSGEGGGDPAPRPGNTSDELEERGANGTSQGPMPPLGRESVLTRIEDVVQPSSAGVAGRHVDFRNVDVESGDARSFWIRDGNSKVAVVANGDARVTAGSKVDVKGITEIDGRGGVRVRAQEIATH